MEPRRRPSPRLVAAHAVGLILALVAVAFCVWAEINWALISDPFRARGSWPNPFAVFPYLFDSWSSLRGGFDWRGLIFGALAVALTTVLGAFLLECFEIYVGRAAWLALAFLFGLGMAGVVLEWLAIPFLLGRGSIAVSLIALLAILALGAWRAARRPPHSIPGAVGDPADHSYRHVQARKAFRNSLTHPRRPHEIIFAVAALFVIAAITAANFWHAILYPEVYWDSLILYMGYARQTFLAHGFPIKVCGHVGIGLGANYPHLYAVLGSGVATAMGEWSELPQRIIAPLAGLATTVLVYQTALRMTRHVNASLAVALLYRSIPLGIMYDQYGSDYALVILFTAGFLYLSILYIQDALPGYFVLMTLLIAISMHINYLMGILWLPWALTIVIAHKFVVPPSGGTTNDAPWTTLTVRPPLITFLFSNRFWLWLVIACAIGSTWYIRNWIVTGNPVYAFFYKFLDGKHINGDVMAAAEREWQSNGYGIGLFGATVLERIRHAWGFFTGLNIVIQGEGAEKTARWTFSTPSYSISPVFMGFAMPALIAWLGSFLALRRGSDKIPGARAFGFVVGTLTLALLAFHFVLAPFYLYQIISIIPCLALLVAAAWPWWSIRPWRWVLGGLALLVAIAPGLGWSLMGFKLIGEFEPTPGARSEYPQTLWPLRHPLPKTSQFYRWRYGDDVVMWDYLNAHLKGEKILTHENRDLVLDPTIEIVNLDDWDMQPLWELPQTERVRRLIENHNIHYYLFVPNELATPTNARMGTAEWPKLGLAELEFQAGENKLYKLK
ncbi:glycosyltransferase family 39 protein [bacterium]|nr:glycosyltransferase family 39 protein [bacterium]